MPGDALKAPPSSPGSQEASLTIIIARRTIGEKGLWLESMSANSRNTICGGKCGTKARSVVGLSPTAIPVPGIRQAEKRGLGIFSPKRLDVCVASDATLGPFHPKMLSADQSREITF